MLEDKNARPELEGFDVETLFEDRVHQRHAFTFKVQGDEFKGHYYQDQIQWLHPHPSQMIGEEQVEFIEEAIHSLMCQSGIASGIKDFQLEDAFENRRHARQKFSLQINGEDYKGYVHEGDIQWFHPQPQQRLDEEQVQAIESEIHEKIAKQSK
ncbi:hypothetical protein [Paenibacillus sp. IITD108]|uniref:hypothetical protein n=1 Tax=Paenibacillus sp. IITD108 TaxID=3116649 RepID=UPI002F3F389E